MHGWLSIKNISHLDIAICSKHQRIQFLEAISCEAVVLRRPKSYMSTVEYMIWLVKRRVHINRFLIPENLYTRDIYTGDIYMEYFQKLIKQTGYLLLNLDCRLVQLKDDTLIEIANVCLNLESLNLAYCFYITDFSMLVISDKCPALKFLDMARNNRVTSDAVIKIAERCQALKSLNLYRCHSITDESIMCIADNCPDLNSLDLSECRNITDISIIRLAQKCPALKMLNLYECDDSR